MVSMVRFEDVDAGTVDVALVEIAMKVTCIFAVGAGVRVARSDVATADEAAL